MLSSTWIADDEGAFRNLDAATKFVWDAGDEEVGTPLLHLFWPGKVLTLEGQAATGALALLSRRVVDPVAVTFEPMALPGEAP